MKRYDAEYDEEDGAYMEESDSGDYVLYSDVEKLLKQQREACCDAYKAFYNHDPLTDASFAILNATIEEAPK